MPNATTTSTISNERPVVFYSAHCFTQIKVGLASYASEYAKLISTTVSEVIDDLIDPHKEPELNMAVRVEFAILYADRRTEVLPSLAIQEDLFSSAATVDLPRATPVIHDFDGFRKAIKGRFEAHTLLSQNALAKRLDLEFYFKRREGRL